MIKQIKIGDLVYSNIDPFFINEKGNKIWNIPTDLEELRKVAIDTVKWDAERQLKKTDWVISKISEIQIEGGDVTSTKEKYADILSQRKVIREKSNEIEEKINMCKTFDELLKVIEDLRI